MLQRSGVLKGLCESRIDSTLLLTPVALQDVATVAADVLTADGHDDATSELAHYDRHGQTGNSTVLTHLLGRAPMSLSR